MKGEKELNTEQTMSKKQNGVLVTAPHFGTGRETVGEFPGYSCGYCQGNGYFQGDITVKIRNWSRAPSVAVPAR